MIASAIFGVLLFLAACAGPFGVVRLLRFYRECDLRDLGVQGPAPADTAPPAPVDRPYAGMYGHPGLLPRPDHFPTQTAVAVAEDVQ